MTGDCSPRGSARLQGRPSALPVVDGLLAMLRPSTVAPADEHLERKGVAEAQCCDEGVLLAREQVDVRKPRRPYDHVGLAEDLHVVDNCTPWPAVGDHESVASSTPLEPSADLSGLSCSGAATCSRRRTGFALHLESVGDAPNRLALLALEGFEIPILSLAVLGVDMPLATNDREVDDTEYQGNSDPGGSSDRLPLDCGDRHAPKPTQRRSPRALAR